MFPTATAPLVSSQIASAAPTHRSRSSRLAHLIGVPAAVLALVVGALLTTTTPADAWTASGHVAKPANVTVPNAAYGVIYYGSGIRLFQISTTGRIVAYRSPATTGAQTVRVDVYFFKSTGGSFFVATSKTLSATIPAGVAYTTLPQVFVNPSAGARGYWSVAYGFNWYNSAGAHIGAMSVSSDRVGENFCTLSTMQCTQYPGMVYVNNAF